MPFPYGGRDTPLPKIDLSDEHLNALGRATVEWSRMESLVETTVWRLAKLDLDAQALASGRTQPLGRAITTHLRLDLWLGQVLSLADETINDAALLIEIANVVKETRKLQKDRHILVHARWKQNGKNDYVVEAVKAREKIISGFYTIALDDIKEFGLASEALANRWNRLQYDLIVPVADFHRGA